MPKFVVAHRSGAHRFAATALYRVLIAQCNKLDAPPQRRQQLRDLIRCRVSAFRHTTSHRELKLLFEAGYEAVDHLDAALAGDAKSAQYVWSLVARAPRHAKASAVVGRRSVSEEYDDPFGESLPAGNAPVEASATSSSDTNGGARTSHEGLPQDQYRPVVARLKNNGPEIRKAEPSSLIRKIAPASAIRKVDSTVPPDSVTEIRLQYGLDKTEPVLEQISTNITDTTFEVRKSIFERAIPREQLGGTGRRQVPKIFSANTIPVLRFKKPQPPNLSSYLNSRIKQRQRRHDLRHALEEQLPVAAQEDQWDAILREHAGIGSAERQQGGSRSVTREERWSSPVRESLKQVNSYLDQEKAKNRAMAEKMYAVIDREAQLVEQERLEHEKKRARVNRTIKREPKGLSDMVSEILGASDGAPRPHG